MLPTTEENLARRFLLGTADETEQRLVGERLLQDDDYAAELLQIEDELIDAFARCELPPDELELFERNFLMTPRRQKALSAAKALARYTDSLPAAESSAVLTDKPLKPNATSHWWEAFFFPAWKPAIAILLLVAGLISWQRMRPKGELEQGLTALNLAYREQRPFEARLSDFDYAPFVVTRGDETAGNYRALDEAEVLLRKAARESNDAKSLQALGKLYLVKREYAKAIEQFELALKAAQTEKATSLATASLLNDLGGALLEKSRVSLRAGDEQQSALELGRSLDELNKAVAADPNLLAAIFNRALCRQVMGLQNQAVAGWNEYLQKDATSRWAEEARQHLREIEDQRQKVSDLKNRAFEEFVTAYKTRDEAKGWEAFKAARKRNGNVVTDQLIDNWLSLSSQGDNVAAGQQLDLLEYGGRLAQERTGDRFTINQAAYYRRANKRQQQLMQTARQTYREAERTYSAANLQAAQTLYERAAEMMRAAGNLPESLLAESWSGYCHARLSNVAAGEAIFTKLTQRYSALRYHSQLSYAHAALADVYFSQDEMALAYDNALRAQQLAKTADDWSCQFMSLGFLASFHEMTGRFEQTTKLSMEAVRLLQQFAADTQQTRAIFQFPPISLAALGYQAAAIDAQQETLKLAAQLQWPLYESLALQKLGQLHAQASQPEMAAQSARLALEKASTIADPALRDNTLADTHLISGQIFQRSGKAQAALNEYEQALAYYEQHPFQYYAYKARQGRFLLRLVTGNKDEAQADLTRIIKDLETYRGQIEAESLRDAFFENERDFYNAAIFFLAHQQKDWRASFELTESIRARSLLGLRNKGAQITQHNGEIDLQASDASRPLDLASLQKQIPPKSQVVVYTLLPDRLLLWVLRADAFQLVQHDIQRDNLTEQMRSFLASLSAATPPDPRTVQKQAEALHAILIEPVASFLQPETLLCLVPDQELHGLPFQALRSSASGKYLIEDFPLVLSPSATIFATSMATAAARENVGSQLLCLGDPQLNAADAANLPALPAAASEASAIKSLYPAGQLWLGVQARKSHFLKQAAQANIIHLASHALADARSPLLSRLFLAADPTQPNEGNLNAYEIYALKLPRTRLVVLSACDTATGRTSSSEGVLSLARPFLASGVPSVIASQWKVESTQTNALMVSFHRFFSTQKLAAAQALRQTQLVQIQLERQATRPSYTWAAFNLFGGTTI